MGKISCVEVVCCCRLRPGVLTAAVIYSILAVFGLFFEVLAYNNFDHVFWVNHHIRILCVVFPRVAAFWTAYVTNQNAVNTGTRWCLAAVYLVTLVIYAMNEVWAAMTN